MDNAWYVFVYQALFFNIYKKLINPLIFWTHTISDIDLRWLTHSQIMHRIM